MVIGVIFTATKTKNRALSINSATNHVEHTHTPTWMNAHIQGYTHTHTKTHALTQITFPLFAPWGKQSPASAAKLPKLSHLLMGYLSSCVSASLSTLMSCLCVVCLSASLPSWMSDVLSQRMLLVLTVCFCYLSAPVRWLSAHNSAALCVLIWHLLFLCKSVKLMNPLSCLSQYVRLSEKYDHVFVFCNTMEQTRESASVLFEFQCFVFAVTKTTYCSCSNYNREVALILLLLVVNISIKCWHK